MAAIPRPTSRPRMIVASQTDFYESCQLIYIKIGELGVLSWEEADLVVRL